MQEVEGIRGGLVEWPGWDIVWRDELEEVGVCLLCKCGAPSPPSLSAVEILGVGNPQSPASMDDVNGDEFI